MLDLFVTFFFGLMVVGSLLSVAILGIAFVGSVTYGIIGGIFQGVKDFKNS
ncbi:hypothetical protein IR120_00115 [Muribacter muris]|uniref:hypothetical protein n=1 Tax=Muribacter muris TaxID=67855 RepID=UPI000A98C2AA|nr:hypothetical protein [Muribacter muris]MBF0783884.1 hypothetical protein [Muribacter muris]MBF0826382.1 hypothetical protein [Muribacter muris]